MISKFLSWLYYTIYFTFKELDKKNLPIAKIALNAFFNDPDFGSVKYQTMEVKGTLGITEIRILMAWNDVVHPLPDFAPNFSFYDDIVSNLPEGTKALVVLTGAPVWAYANKDVIGTFIDRWVKPVSLRYKDSDRILGYQVWNEPNSPDFGENEFFGTHDPSTYFWMLQRAHEAIKTISPDKLVVNAATTSLAQNYPKTLKYNSKLLDLGLMNYTDAFAVHYYATKPVNLFRKGGVADFLQQERLQKKPIWVTEIGTEDPSKQLGFAQRNYALLCELVKNIEKLYIYKFTSTLDHGYGLKISTDPLYISDLYKHLRELYLSS